MPQTVATQVAGQMSHCAMFKKIRCNCCNVFCNWSRNVLAVAWYVTLGNDSCNLSHSGVASQVARKIALCNSALRCMPTLIRVMKCTHFSSPQESWCPLNLLGNLLMYSCHLFHQWHKPLKLLTIAQFTLTKGINA